MTDQSTIQLSKINDELCKIADALAPWTGVEEMLGRYDVKTSKTLLQMERRGDIPAARQRQVAQIGGN